MYDYSRLPTLVLNQIFGYLSVKERVRCKGVCRTWRTEIELRDRKSDTLVMHLGPYPWNIRWSETNNRRLMKFENSFQMKHLAFLEHPMTRALLEKTKKLAIVKFHNCILNPEMSSIQPYLGYFKHCEQIEFRSLYIERTLTFDLPNLKVLVLINCAIDELVLNCPSLEVLFWDWEVNEIDFQDAKKLKRLICFGWPATVSLNGKFDALQYLNLFIARDERVSDRLLDRMPKLKRLMLYSRNPQADLEIIREQQKRLGLKNLEVLFNGFRDPVEISISPNFSRIMIEDSGVVQLHENYSKLMENSPWSVSINYSQLFSKFKILPSDFFERFSNPLSIEISEVTNHTHLLSFLKRYPIIEQLKLHYSKVKGKRILDLVYSLQPSLAHLAIVEDRPLDLLDIDLSFLRLLDLPQLCLECPRLPIEFVRRVADKLGAQSYELVFTEATHDGYTTGNLVIIYFDPRGPRLSVRNNPRQYFTIEQLIAHMQIDPDLHGILL